MADARSGAELIDYSKTAFSIGGVRQEISIDDWRNGWAAIVGGLDGKPTSQQFNMVFYILSVLLNQNISDVSAVKNTANAALPKENFTAQQIVTLLSRYGRMSGCDADMLDGKHANEFAAAKHSHAASDITSGNLPIERGGTGAAPLLMRVVLLAPCGTQAEPLQERSILQMAQRTMSGLREMRILSR